MNVTITTDGQIRFVATAELQPLYDLGQVTTWRASHVMPQNSLLRRGFAFRIGSNPAEVVRSPLDLLRPPAGRVRKKGEIFVRLGGLVGR